MKNKKKRKTQSISRPRVAIIFHLPYSISWVTSKIISGGDKCDGLCESGRQKLSVTTSLPRQQQVETLIHEVLHAVNTEIGVNDQSLKTMTEEDLTSRLAKAACKILQDNPEGVCWSVDLLTDWS